METFSALLDICAENLAVFSEFPAQRPVTVSFHVFFDLRLNNDWINNGEAGDLRRHRAHYDVIVMECLRVFQADRIMPWLAILFQQIFDITTQIKLQLEHNHTEA